MERLLAEHLWLVVWVAEAGWALRLWLLAEHKRYPALFTFLVVSASQSVVCIATIEFIGWNSVTYLWIWSSTQPVLWLLLLVVLYELYSHLAWPYLPLLAVGDGVLASLLIVIPSVSIPLYLAGGAKPGTFWIGAEPIAYGVLLMISLAILIVANLFHLMPTRATAGTFAAVELVICSHALMLGFGDQLGDKVFTVRYVGLPLTHIAAALIGAWSFHPTKTSTMPTPDWQSPSAHPQSQEQARLPHRSATKSSA